MQADLWPQVRTAAAQSGTAVEAVVTAAYLASLIRDSPALDCQRITDAAAALTTLLRASAAAAVGEEVAPDVPGAAARLRVELEQVSALLADSAGRPAEVEALLEVADAQAGSTRLRRRQRRVASAALGRWRSAAEVVQWLQTARPMEVVQAVRAAAEWPAVGSAGAPRGDTEEQDIRAALGSSAEVRVSGSEHAWPACMPYSTSPCWHLSRRLLLTVVAL